MAAYQELFIDQGTTFNAQIPVKGKTGQAIDISGYLARGQIRKHWSSKKVINFLTRIDDPATGIVFIGLSPEQTRGFRPGRYWFDLELYDDTVIPTKTIRIIEGQVVLSPRITRGEEEEAIGESEPYENITDDGWFYDQ